MTTTAKTPLQEYPVSTRTRVEQGVVLPWERRGRYGPPIEDVEIGELKESGEVFVSLEDLYAVNEQGVWDSQFGNTLLVGFHEGLALEQAGLAVAETRGGYHGSPKLSVWLAEYERSQGEHGADDKCTVSSEVEV